jgi:hypothetical protein
MQVSTAAWIKVTEDAIEAGIFPKIDHIPSDEEIGQRRHGAKKRASYVAAKSLYHLGRTALFGKRELSVSLKSNETIANKPNPLDSRLEKTHPLVKCRKQDLARETALSSGLGEVNFARVRDKQTGRQEGVPRR